LTPLRVFFFEILSVFLFHLHPYKFYQLVPWFFRTVLFFFFFLTTFSLFRLGFHGAFGSLVFASFSKLFGRLFFFGHWCFSERVIVSFEVFFFFWIFSVGVFPSCLSFPLALSGGTILCTPCPYDWFLGTIFFFLWLFFPPFFRSTLFATHVSL